MKNIKIGDYVRGNKDNKYNITSKNNICLVVDFIGDKKEEMVLLVVQDNQFTYSDDIGKLCKVKTKYFNKVEYIENNYNNIEGEIKKILEIKNITPKGIDNKVKELVKKYQLTNDTIIEYFPKVGVMYMNKGKILNIIQLCKYEGTYKLNSYKIHPFKNSIANKFLELEYRGEISYHEDLLKVFENNIIQDIK